MHAVVMACVCRACKRERGREREGEPKQICKYFIERPRPRGPPPKLRNYGILEQQPG